MPEKNKFMGTVFGFFLGKIFFISPTFLNFLGHFEISFFVLFLGVTFLFLGQNLRLFSGKFFLWAFDFDALMLFHGCFFAKFPRVVIFVIGEIL